jgi:hypothetical protein
MENSLRYSNAPTRGVNVGATTFQTQRYFHRHKILDLIISGVKQNARLLFRSRINLPVCSKKNLALIFDDRQANFIAATFFGSIQSHISGRQ